MTMDDLFITAQIIFEGLPPAKLSANGRRVSSWHAEHAMTKEVKETFGWQAKAKWEGPPLEGPLAVTWIVVWPKKSRASQRDLDNMVPLLKGVQDSCNGVVWTDDRHIVQATYEKRTDDTGTWPQGCIILRVDRYTEEPLPWKA